MATNLRYYMILHNETLENDCYRASQNISLPHRITARIQNSKLMIQETTK